MHPSGNSSSATYQLIGMVLISFDQFRWLHERSRKYLSLLGYFFSSVIEAKDIKPLQHTGWAAIETLLTIDERGSTMARNSAFDCHLSPVGRQMAIENTVPNDFNYVRRLLRTFIDCQRFFIYVRRWY